MWGIYFKPDFDFGVCRAVLPQYIVDRPAAGRRRSLRPAEPRVRRARGLHADVDLRARAQPQALRKQRHLYRKEPSGGIGAFTPDSFPVFDTFCQNAYVIADSNHGYKMIGVGALVAKEVLGEPQVLLEPFRFSRYTTGKLHPVSNSPFPWS